MTAQHHNLSLKDQPPTTNMDFNELISDFASRYGVEGLSAQAGAVALEIDGMTVGFVNDPSPDEGDGLMVVVEIGYPPPDADGPFGAAMLKANYLLGGTGGAILCQNPDTEAYAVMRRYPLSAHDVASFSSALEKLLATAENWKEVLGGMRTAEEAQEELAEEDEPDGEDSSSDFSGGEFMKV